jgi:hypothetical protein
LAPSANNTWLQQQQPQQPQQRRHLVAEDVTHRNDQHDAEGGVGETRIPLLVEVPSRHQSSTVVSPPSSVGSDLSAHDDDLDGDGDDDDLYDYRFDGDHHGPDHDHGDGYYYGHALPHFLRRRKKRSFRRRILKMLLQFYHLIFDLLLIVFVCVMGIFFDVEVQVVKQDRRQRAMNGAGRRGHHHGSGRVVIQTSTAERDGDNDDDKYGPKHKSKSHSPNYHHRFTKLLRSPPQSDVSMNGGSGTVGRPGEEDYWYTVTDGIV